MQLFPEEFEQNLLPFDGQMNFKANFLSQEESQLYFKELLAITPWQSDVVHLFGKEYTSKRKIALYGDPNTSYTYSQVKKTPLEWTPTLLSIKSKIEQFCGARFNSCLLNLYHNGQEGMSWHSDNEKELGTHPAIASISLGAPRKFAWKHKKSKARYDKLLPSGSLIYMHGSMQEHWLHSIPKTKKVNEPRINLSFRQIQT